MGLNAAPSSSRTHIGFFGRRNAGKSSVVNAVTGQALAIVSETKGTTTDPVLKSMELLPLGPVVIIDTPGMDDEGPLGEQRVKKARQALNRADIAVLVADATQWPHPCDRALMRIFEEKDIPYIVALNKCDLLSQRPEPEKNAHYVSAVTGEGVDALKERIARLLPTDEPRRLVGDLIKPGDLVALVVPIDSAAPKGRLILPQQQAIRDILEADAAAVVVKDTGLREALLALNRRPALVVTDSQVFAQAADATPKDIALTSFSILMARYKGFLETAVRGVAAIERLGDGDRVLIAEGCTHHRQCEDIGSVKIPGWLRAHTGKNLQITTASGTEFPEDLTPYALVIHCGGCMLNEREMRYRMKCAVDQQVPFTNYGTAIAHIQGILRRSLSIFPGILALLDAQSPRQA
jgi:[FeFe] hydrogenase H-cluster maturation GTPase HydF